MYPPPNFSRTPKQEVSEHVDWYSATFPVDVKITNLLPENVAIERCKSPIPVYPVAIQDTTYGIKIMYGGGARLGVHAVWSGKVLDALRQDGYTDSGIWQVIKLNNGKLSRIDIAVDIIDSKIDVNDFVLRDYDKVSNLLGSVEISKNDNNETIYLGNPKSKSRKLRIYNKAIETGVIDFEWLRIEYEKRRNADILAYTLFQTEATIRSLIKSVVDYPHWREFQDVFNAEITPITRGQAKAQSTTEYGDKMNWLVTSCAPLLAKMMVQDAVKKNQDLDDCDALNTFISSLNVEISKIIKG